MTRLPSDTLSSLLDNDCFTTVQELGDCYTSVGQYQPAQSHYERAASLEPDDPRPYIGLGVIAIQQNRFDDADTAFRVAVRLDPNSSRAHAGLAIIAQNRQQYDEAFACYMKSLECDPDNMTALLGLFQTSCQMGSFDQVIHYLELYLRTHAEDTSVLFSLAALYVRDGSLIKAKRVLTRLVSLTPENGDAVNLLEEVEHSLTREVAAQQITPLPRGTAGRRNTA
jgi:Flp pilus assembly protein TadD